MITAYPFIYGRTRTVDYRWLQPPVHMLRIGFFADALEMCSPLLRKGERCYYVGINKRVCIFSVLLSLPKMYDQRGRPISFVLGYTVDPKFARDFAYYLPALLESGGQLVEDYVNYIHRSVASDNEISIPPFDPFASKSLSIGQNYPDLHRETEGFSPYLHVGKNKFGKELINFSDGWLKKTANEIRSCVNTPKMVSNFDTSQLGSFIDVSSGSLSNSMKISAHLIHDGSVVEQLRQFVSNNVLPSEETGSEPAPPSGRSIAPSSRHDSVQDRNGTSRESSRGKHFVQDRDSTSSTYISQEPLLAHLISFFRGGKNQQSSKNRKDE